MTLPWPGRGGGASTASEFDPANDSSLAKSPTDRPANAASRFGGLDANSGSVESDWDVGALTLEIKRMVASGGFWSDGSVSIDLTRQIRSHPG